MPGTPEGLCQVHKAFQRPESEMRKLSEGTKQNNSFLKNASLIQPSSVSMFFFTRRKQNCIELVARPADPQWPPALCGCKGTWGRRHSWSNHFHELLGVCSNGHRFLDGDVWLVSAGCYWSQLFGFWKSLIIEKMKKIVRDLYFLVFTRPGHFYWIFI